jgi:HEAT repeat protein
LHDGDPEHRKNTVISLGTVGAVSQTVRLIENVLKTDKSGLVRQTAAATLGDIKSRQSIPALRAALDDTPEVSFAAARALEEMGDTSGRTIVEEVLLGERRDRPGFVHRGLRTARQKLHQPSQLAVLGAKQATGVFLGPASMSFTLAQMAMNEDGSKGRVAAVTTLSQQYDSHSVRLLEEALKDKSWPVRAAAAKAVGQRGNLKSIPKLEPLLHDDRNMVRNMAAASMVKLILKGT